jgi:hypothetical protein
MQRAGSEIGGSDLKRGRTGTRGCGRSDQDLTVRIKGGHDLISTVDNRSNGPEKGEARLAALTAGERKAAAARLGSSPEIRDHAFPGTVHDGITPRRLSTTQETSWARVEVDLSSVRVERRLGRLGTAGNTGERCSRHSGHLETTTSGAKGPGRECEAHRGVERAGTRRRDDFNGGPAVEAIGVLADSSLWCSAQPAGPPNQPVQVL